MDAQDAVDVSSGLDEQLHACNGAVEPRKAEREIQDVLGLHRSELLVLRELLERELVQRAGNRMSEQDHFAC
eukprot:515975-Rhodomonas_salina.4